MTADYRIFYRDVFYRDVTPEDRSARKFVIATWASSYKNSQYAGLFISEDWPEQSHKTLEKLLDRPGTRTILAHGVGRSYFGFICGDISKPIPIVHYVYVKDPYRSELIDGERSGPRHARALFAELGVDPAAPFLYTCKTASAVILRDKIPRAKFAPAAARYANYQEHQERRIT